MRFNAGKESVAIDLAHPQARSVALDLARAADVLVENFVPGVMARHGLDYGAVSAVNPAIVYCSISGYGQTGPLRDRPAFAHLINAASGAMDLDRQGDPSRAWPTCSRRTRSPACMPSAWCSPRSCGASAPGRAPASMSRCCNRSGARRTSALRRRSTAAI